MADRAEKDGIVAAAGGPTLKVRVVRSGARLPAYQTAGAAGLDLAACVDSPVRVPPAARVAVPTGLAIELPAGHEGQVRPRSGLALRHGITVLNAPGTIDADYRGELTVLLVNTSDEPFVVEDGARVAQLVVAPVTRVRVVEVEAREGLSDTERGAGGFGSTGLGGDGT